MLIIKIMTILMVLLLSGCGGADNKELSPVEDVPPSIDSEEFSEPPIDEPSESEPPIDEFSESEPLVEEPSESEPPIDEPLDPEPPIDEPLDPEPPPSPPLTQQERYLAAVNKFRATEQLCPGEGTVYAVAQPVRWDGNLELAAIAHSVDMAENDFFSHIGSDNSHFSSRAFRAGYKGSALFEVIAAGNSDFDRTLNQWINSRTGHCGFLMRREINEIGAGFSFDPTSTYGYYWTLLGGIE